MKHSVTTRIKLMHEMKLQKTGNVHTS